MKFNSWFEAARYCEDTYGVYVDWDENFFHCPNCDEPLLKEDWEHHNWNECPVCEVNFTEIE